MLVNLRGVKESGTFFAIPTFFFLLLMFGTLGVGMLRYLTGDLGVVQNPPPLEIIGSSAVTVFLVLRAFANGTTALTGIEAISNGIMAFKQPRSRNASITLAWMAAILATLFLGITFLAREVGALPSEAETVISQVGRTVLAGRGPLYLALISSTTLILVMAANTAFADFPRLAALIAKEGFLPRQFSFQGSRLVFSRGIMALAILASILIAIFKASVTLLIPLYAVGVFLSFTLSQSGMARHWWRLRPQPGEGEKSTADAKWLLKMVFNGLGALTTGVVTIIFALTKFLDGAWVIFVVIPVVVAVFRSIKKHYIDVADNLSLSGHKPDHTKVSYKVIIPLQSVHRGSLKALKYASAISKDITAVHISLDKEESKKLRRRWRRWGRGKELVIIDSPYRLLLEPLLAYIRESVSTVSKNQKVIVVVPEFVPKERWHNLLHMNTASWLRRALLTTRDVTIMEVPYQMR